MTIEIQETAPNTYCPRAIIDLGPDLRPATVGWIAGYHSPKEDAEFRAQALRTAHLIDAAPAMLAALQGVLDDWQEIMESDEPINGGDAVDWLCGFYERAKDAAALATGTATGEPEAPAASPTVEGGGAFVAIYDSGSESEPIEEYYGFFSTADDARRMFGELARGQSYRNAKICQIVESITGNE